MGEQLLLEELDRDVVSVPAAWAWHHHVGRTLTC